MSILSDVSLDSQVLIQTDKNIITRRFGYSSKMKHDFAKSFCAVNMPRMYLHSRRKTERVCLWVDFGQFFAHCAK